MKDKEIFKEAKVCLKSLLLNVPSYENFCKDETCSQNSQLARNFAKKNVSFSEESSILYFTEDDTTSSLQNSSSVIFNHSDESLSTDKAFNATSKTSLSRKDVSVVIEKLPQNLIEEYAKKNIIYDECSQKIILDQNDKHCNSRLSHDELLIENGSSSDHATAQKVDHSAPLSKDFCNTSPSVVDEIEYPIRELSVVIQRLPDNLLKMHWNHVNTHISPENDISRIPSVTACLEKPETETHGLKHQADYRTKEPKSKKKKRNSGKQMKSKTKKKQLNLSDKLFDCFLPFPVAERHESLPSSTVPEVSDISGRKESEIKIKQKASGTLVDRHVSNLTPHEIVPSVQENANEDLSVPNIKTSRELLSDSSAIVTALEGSSVDVFLEENSLSKPTSVVLRELYTEGNMNNQNLPVPFDKRLCVHLEKLDLKILSIYLKSSKKAIRKKSHPDRKGCISKNKDFPVSSIFKSAPFEPQTSYTSSSMKSHSKSIKKGQRSRTGNTSLKGDLPAPYISKNNYIVPSTSANSNENYQNSVNDTSSDDDVPLLCLAKNTDDASSDDDMPLLQKLLTKSNSAEKQVLKVNSNESVKNKSGQPEKGQTFGTKDLNLLSCLTTVNYAKGDLPASYISKNNYTVPSTSANSNENCQNSVNYTSSDDDVPLLCLAKNTDDASSDDDLPLLQKLLTKSNSTEKQVLKVNSNESVKNESGQPEKGQTFGTKDVTLLSCLTTVNYANSPDLLIKPLRDMVSYYASEENDPLSCLAKTNFLKTSHLTNMNTKRNKNHKKIMETDHCYSKLLNNQNNSIGSKLEKVMLDHCYHKPPSNNTHVESLSTLRVQKKNSNAFSSNIDLQSLITDLQSEQRAEKISKQDDNVVKNKNEMLKSKISLLRSKILANKCLSYEDLSSKLNGNLKTKNKNKVGEKKTSKKKKGNKKALMKKQAKVYDMMIKYLRKQIKPKSKKKSFRKAKKVKNNSKEQCGIEQPELLNIKVEPESECDTVTADEAGEIGEASVDITNYSSVITEDTIRAVPEPSCTVDISQCSKDGQKHAQEKAIDKYRLGFLSKNKTLRMHNTCLASERLLLYKCKTKKRQRKKLKRLFKRLKKVCRIEEDQI